MVTTTKYLWNDLNDTVAMVKDGDNNTIATYQTDPNGQLRSMRRGGKTYNYHFMAEATPLTSPTRPAKKPTPTLTTPSATSEQKPATPSTRTASAGNSEIKRTKRRERFLLKVMCTNRSRVVGSTRSNHGSLLD